MALRRNGAILTKNKRSICRLQTEAFGQILYIEVGATNVGSIHQTYTPFVHQEKGAEKGYFSFGASTVLLLFRKQSIQFDSDLLEASQQNLEIKCLMGQRMGVKK
jgi:phosphatidylserine decarboxylase